MRNKILASLFAFAVFSGCQSAPRQAQNQQVQQPVNDSGVRKLSSDEQKKETAAEKRECKPEEKKNMNGDCVHADSFNRPFHKNGR